MLETLLNHFRSYGLNDLEFIIVNSKLSHSQDRLHELKRRVSFDVFQETEEEQVWNLMEGGKDDMYIYDRCGRLTYYIPYPLSILNESPLVANAILKTYFRSPCGDNCEQNKTVDLDEFVRHLERNLETSNETQEVNETYVETEATTISNETYNETLASNDLFRVFDDVHDEIDVSNTSLFSNVTDYEYPDYDNNSYANNTNNTSVDEAKTYFNSIYRLFFSNENSVEEKQTNNETLVNGSISSSPHEHSSEHNYTQSHKIDNLNLHQHNSHNSHHRKNAQELREIKKSDRCLEADYQVCKSWSKKRLLHAQKCCSGTKSEAEIVNPRSCDHFGKKRCKKIQSILKCCIKTLYTEPSSDISSIETTLSPEEDPETISENDPQRQQEPTQTSDIVCCKTVSDGKLCRVINSGTCKEGEYTESSSSQGK